MKSRNKKQRDSFIEYCKEHPQERFWQALRNWSGYGFVGYSIDGKEFRDLFYKEGV
jgi:hypothetical protein